MVARRKVAGRGYRILRSSGIWAGPPESHISSRNRRHGLKAPRRMRAGSPKLGESVTTEMQVERNGNENRGDEGGSSRSIRDCSTSRRRRMSRKVAGWRFEARQKSNRSTVLLRRRAWGSRCEHQAPPSGPLSPLGLHPSTLRPSKPCRQPLEQPLRRCA